MCNSRGNLWLFYFKRCYSKKSIMRKEFCEKDGILITYTENDVCFEDCKTAEAILLKNDGTIIHSNFSDERNLFFQDYLKRIYSEIINCRNLDAGKQRF